MPPPLPCSGLWELSPQPLPRADSTEATPMKKIILDNWYFQIQGSESCRLRAQRNKASLIRHTVYLQSK